MMPHFDDHCQQAFEKFGKPYEMVHKWLDELAFKPPHGIHHRKIRHHLAGIEEVRKLWGNEAAAVARQHIIADLNDEGWKEGIYRFPKDEADYVKMGLF